MARAKNGFSKHRKHRKVWTLAKGFRGSRNRLFKRANEAVLRSGRHAFEGRIQRKRDMRTLWIQRINGALYNHGIKYSRFISGLKKANITLDRKMLSEMAINDPKGFDSIVTTVKKASN